MEVFAIYVHATFSNGCVVHVSIIGINTRWKFCNVINFIVKSSFERKHDDNTKPKVKNEVHTGNNISYIPCTLPLIAVIFGRCLTTLTNLCAIPKGMDTFSMCWSRMNPQNMMKYPRQKKKSSRENGHAWL